MRRWLRENRGLLLFLLLLGTFRTAVADWNPVPSASMRPTILEGDVVCINRLAFDLKLPLTDIVLAQLGQPRRGDIVTFSSPTDGTRLIKRIAALPGDLVAMQGGALTINGRRAAYAAIDSAQEPPGSGHGATLALRIDETVDGRPHRIQLLPQRAAVRDFGPLRVADGHYLMLGDNRDNSGDSRVFGTVPRALLIGRAERVLVSADITGNWLPRPQRFGMRLEK